MKATDPRFRALLKKTYIAPNQSINKEVVANSVKTFVKQWPWFYHFLEVTIGPCHSPWNRYNPKERITELFGDTLSDIVILNLGSGTHRIHTEIINVDLFPFKEVDLVADICNMPLQDNSVDGIVCEYVLEHVADTPRLFTEVCRVLKPGGTFILTAPFIYPYHSSPNDYFRWTKEGLAYALTENNFDIKDCGVHGGPMGALQGILMHVFAILFSFGSKTVYFFLVQFFMVLFSPLKLLDTVFILSPFSADIAASLFFIVEKKK